MDKILDVAAYVARKYQEISNEKIDEMKLHKLLYFIQRESFALLGTPAFRGEFEGWKYGPVSREVRANYCDGDIICQTEEPSDDVAYIADNVLAQYGPIETWRLSQLSHQDSSWLNSRAGLAPDDIGHVPLKLEDIQKDAEKVRPYDHLWDMYYDEFEDEVVS